MNSEQGTHWNLIEVTVPLEAEEFIREMLFELGTTGLVTLEETDQSIRLGSYFTAESSAEDLAQLIESRLTQYRQTLLRISVTEVPDEDWMHKWKQGFEPIPIGERLIVAPSWKVPETSQRTVIEIDPGMAFGTGTHETTRLCLEAIEKYWRGGRLLDVGTGTGILAIAAAKLVPDSQITGIDIDPLAVKIARENIELNKVDLLVEIREGQPRDLNGEFDVVVANLTADVISQLIDELTNVVAQDGILILSGILVEYSSDVRSAATGAGLVFLAGNDAGEWCEMTFKRYTLPPK